MQFSYTFEVTFRNILHFAPTFIRQRRHPPHVQELTRQSQRCQNISDYCDVYLTHDSMSVRKAHNSGRNHLRNVVEYYQRISQEQAQQVIDNITNAYEEAGQGSSNPMIGAQAPGSMPAFPPGFPAMPNMPAGMPPLNFAPPQGMPPGFPPGGMPPPPGGMPPGFPPPQQGSANSPFPPGGMPFPPPGGMPPGFGAAGSPAPGPAGSPPAGMPPGFGGPPPGMNGPSGGQRDGRGY
ncbi:hypothetical protein MBLNU230_g4049t1 [Neophaeotheca triangularis]